MKHSVFVMDIHKCFPCLSDPKISLFIYQGDERARTVRDGAETPTGHDGPTPWWTTYGQAARRTSGTPRSFWRQTSRQTPWGQALTGH